MVDYNAFNAGMAASQAFANQRQQAAVSQMRDAFASGDRAGAQQIAQDQGGDVMAAFREEVAAADDNKRQFMARQFDTIGRVVNAMRDTRVEHRSAALQAAAPQLFQVGVQPEQLAEYDAMLSDPATSDAVLQVLSARVLDANSVFEAYQPRMQAENEVLSRYQGGELTQGPINPNATANRAIDQQNADSTRMNANSTAAGVQIDRDRLALDREKFEHDRENPESGQRPSAEQMRAGEFVSRMERANEAINQLEQSGVINPTARGRLRNMPVVGDTFRGDEFRAYDQAIDEFSLAILRRESGAAISAQERAEIARTYFPQPGDGPQTVEQKRQARIAVIEDMRRASNGAYATHFARPGNLPQQAQAEPSIEDLLNQYGG